MALPREARTDRRPENRRSGENTGEERAGTAFRAPVWVPGLPAGDAGAPLWWLLSVGSAHARLEISQPGDAAERDADELAETLTGCCSDCAAGGPCASGGQGGPGGKLQRQHDGAAGDASVAADVREVKAGLGAGQPLDPLRQQRFEERSGVRLDGVRVHTDERAAASARAVGALAYTLGPDVVFAPGRFAPHTSAGERLLAHEIAHVVQDRRARPAKQARLHRQVVAPAPAPGVTPPSPAPPTITTAAGAPAAAPAAPSAAPPAAAVPPAVAAPAATGKPAADPAITAKVDAIVADLRGVTTRWASARILAVFTDSTADQITAIFAEMRHRGGEDWVRWLFGDLTAEDADKLRALLLRQGTGEGIRQAAAQVRDLLAGYTSEADSHEIVALLTALTPALLTAVLTELEGLLGKDAMGTAGWLLGDLDRVSAWRLAGHFYTADSTKAADYAVTWTTDRVLSLLAGWTSSSDSHAVVRHLELVPAAYLPIVMGQVQVKRVPGGDKMQFAHELMADLTRSDYQRIRAMPGAELPEYDRPTGVVDVAKGIADWLGAVDAWLVCGAAGLLTGLVSVIADLAVAIKDIAVGVVHLLMSLVYAISGGSVGSAHWLAVKRFFGGLADAVGKPRALLGAMWEDLRLEFTTIEGPFSDCRRAEFVVRKLINAIVNILLIALAGYGLVKEAISGIQALREFAALAREVGIAKALASTGAGAGRVAKTAVALGAGRVVKVLELLRRPAALLGRMRQNLMRLLLAAERQNYLDALRRSAGRALLDEQTFWRNRPSWQQRAQAYLTEQEQLAARAKELEAAAQTSQAPDETEAAAQGVNKGTADLDHKVGDLTEEMTGQPPQPAEPPKPAEAPKPTEPPKPGEPGGHGGVAEPVTGQATVEQRQAEVAAVEDEITELRGERATAEAHRLAEKDALVRQAIAKDAEASRLEQQARGARDPAQRAKLEEDAARAREEHEAAKQQQIENQEEVNRLNRDLADAEKRLATARERLKLAEAGRRISDTQAVTARLQGHVDATVDEFETGKIGPSPKQAQAAASGGPSIEAQRGSVIDAAAKQKILADAELAGLKVTPQGVFGPDIYDPLTKRWWDITTPEEWADHVKLYSPEFGTGTPLFTRPPRPK
jgi:hypothetical protein